MILLKRGQHTLSTLFKKGVIWLGAFLCTTSIFANPVVDRVTAGNVSIQQTPNSTVVNQGSQRAIINWKSFNIGNQESTHFQQPAGGVALNRINPNQGPSAIYGRLTATGQIILVNSAGIFFGPGAYVNVGGLIASTADITDQNFLNGYYRFDIISPTAGSIINQGHIIAADHGLIALLGNGVQNDGLVQANLGKVILASGETFAMNFAGNELISFSVDGKALQGVTNLGTLSANGGSILVSAKTTQNILDNSINMKGFVEARSVQERNGEIIISGDEDHGVVNVAANIDASGKQLGEKGGNVTITGYNILLDSPTVIDASGDLGGGNILIGGNYQGKGPLPNANATVMLADTSIKADALTHGNGGQIILWADDVTRAYGNISARGGALSGDGGFVETSGKNFLDIGDIRVDTRAPYGKIGTWLLDPRNVTINAVSTTGGTFNGANPNVFTPTADDATVLNTTIQTNLATASVTINTGSTGVQAGNITVDAPITWASSNTLLLQAANNIIINAAISGTSGSLNIQAGNGSGTPLNSTITTGAGGTINVANFNLISGTWSQVGTLPSFNVTNNFRINSGTLPNTNARFLRASGGTGAGGSPYQIVDVYGLQGIGSTSTSLGQSYVLANNIDATVTSNWNSGAGFVPIGTNTAAFTGSLDGQDFIIDNLFINRAINNVGLIGFANNAGTVLQNLGLTDVVITGTNNVAAAVGWQNTGTINSVYVTGTVSGAGDIGGIVGHQENPGTVTNSYSTAAITGSGSSIGGVIGYMGNSISNSYATGNITGLDYVGGLVGYANFDTAGSISNSYATGNVSGRHDIGGLLGHSGPLTTPINGVKTDITNSFALGSVVASGDRAGGLVGRYIESATSTGVISNSFSAGYVSAGTSAGGFLGAATNGSFSNNYWNTQTSGISTASTAAMGLTTLDAQTQASFSGWDFTTVWNIISEQSYPYLRAFNTTPPRILSGTSVAAGNTNVAIVGNGTNLYTVRTGANGYFYSMFANGAIADSTNLLIYLDGVAAGNRANVVAIAPATGGSLSGSTGLALTAGTVQVGAASGSATYSNTSLSTALGGILDSDILYSLSGTDLTLAANTSLLVTSPSTYSANGDITAATGTLTFNGNVIIDDPSVTLTGTNNVIIAGNIDGGGNALSISTNGASSAVNGVISNLTAFNKEGSGILTLSGANTYTGTTNINAGTLRLGASNVLSDNTAVTLANVAGATFDLSNNSDTIASLAGGGATGGNVTIGSGALTTGDASNTTFSGTISGDIDSDLIKQGSGIFTLANTNNDFIGATTINDGTLRLNVEDALINSSNIDVVSGTFDLNNLNQTIGGFSGNGTVSLGSATLTFGNGFGDVSTSTAFGGFITGSGTVIKDGIGTFTFSGSAQNAGGITINGGTLLAAFISDINTHINVGSFGTFDLDNNDALIGRLSGSGNVLLGSGTLTTGNGDSTFSGVISGTGGLTTNGGTLTLSGVNTYTGVTTINAFTGLTLGNVNAIDDSSNVVADGTFDINNLNPTINNFSGNGTVSLGSGTLTFGGDNDSTSFGGFISGSGTLVKEGTGTFTIIGGSQTPGGGITINDGTLLTSSGFSNINTHINIGASGTFDLDDNNSTIGRLSGSGSVLLGSGTLTTGNGDSTFSGVISGTGGLTTNGGTLTLSGINSYTGTTTINAFTGLTLGDVNTIDSSSNVVVNGTLNINSLNPTINDISGSGFISLGSGTLITGSGSDSTFSGVISGVTGNLIKQGSGVFTLSGTNTYTGTTTINAGTLRLGASDVLSNSTAVTLADAVGVTLDLNNNSDTIASLAGGGAIGGNVTLGSGTLTTGGAGNTTFSGIISGTNGNLIKQGAGIFTLSSANTYSGTTTINAGTLRLGIANAILNTSDVAVNSTLDMTNLNQSIGGFSGNGTVLLGNATLTFGETSSGISTNTSFGGTISGSAGNGSLVKQGAGTFTLTTGADLSGVSSTTINAGTIQTNAANVFGANNNFDITGTFNLNSNDQTIGALSGSGDILLGSATLTAGGGTSTFSGVISGTGNLIVNNGALTLSGINTYTGATIINPSSSLILGNADAINDSSNIDINGTFEAIDLGMTLNNISGDGDIVFGNGTLTFGNNTDTSFSGGIFGTGTLVKQGTGTFTVIAGADLSNVSNIAINGGSLQTNIADVFGNSTSLTIGSGGVFNLNNNSQTLGSLASGGTGIGAVQLGSATLTIGGDNSSTTYGGSITGTTGGITKEGTGNLQLASTAGVNSYSGDTTINAGTLTMRGSDDLIPLTSNVIVAAGATFDVAGTTQTIGSLSGSGNVVLGSMDGLGTLTPGLLITGNNNSSTTFSGVISEFAGTVSALTKIGTGTLTLSGINTYTGLTTVSTGTLSVNSASALGTTATGTVVSSGATLNINNVSVGNEAITLNGATLTGLGTAALSGNVTLGASSIMSASTGDALTLSGTINGGSALTLQGLGTITLGGAVGGTTPLSSLIASVSGLNINGGSITTLNDQTYNGALTLGADTTFTTSGAGSATIAMNNGIAGNQNVIFTGGAGVNDTFNITGALAVNNVTVNGNGGTNALLVNTGGTQQWNISGGNSGNITGIAGVAGNFNYSNVNNLTGGSGNDSFTLNGGTVSGTISGGAGTNSLTAANVANTWNLSGTDAGTVTGVGGYSSIQNLIGGNSNNTFIFNDGAIVTGNVNGGSLANVNTLNYSSYGAPITLYLTTTNDGVAQTGAQTVASYSNITHVMGDYTNDIIQVPSSKFVVTYTGTQEGYINDPIFFFGYTVLGATPAPTPTPTTSTDPNVSGIVQQPVVNGDTSANSPTTSTPTWVTTSDFTSENLEEILNDFTTEYNETLKKVQINPLCFAGQ